MLAFCSSINTQKKRIQLNQKLRKVISHVAYDNYTPIPTQTLIHTNTFLSPHTTTTQKASQRNFNNSQSPVTKINTTTKNVLKIRKVAAARKATTCWRTKCTRTRRFLLKIKTKGQHNGCVREFKMENDDDDNMYVS